MPKANPYAALLDPAEEAEEVPGWVRRGIFLVNKATGEKKLSPKFKGGEPGLGKEKTETPMYGMEKIFKPAAAGARLLGSAILDNVTSAPEQAEALLDAPRALVRKAILREPIATVKTAAELARGPERSVLRDDPYRQVVRDRHQEAIEGFAEATQGLPTPLSAGLYGALELGAGLVDPTNLPLAAAPVARRAGQEALETVGQRAVKAALGEGDNAALRAVRTPETGIGLDDLLRPAEPDPALAARFPGSTIDARSVYEDALIPPARTGLPPVEIRPGGVDVRSYDLSTGRFKLEGGTDEFARRAADAGGDRGLLAGGRLAPPELAALPGGGVPGPEPALAAARSGEAGFVSTEPLANAVSSLRRNLGGGGPSQGRFNVAADAFDQPAQKKLVEGIPRRIETMEGRHRMALEDARSFLKEADKVVRQVAPSKAARRQSWRDLEDAVEGRIPLRHLDPQLQPLVARANGIVDNLQQYGLQSGALPPKAVTTGGAYRHRTYRAFEDPRWIKKIENTPKWQAGYRYLDQTLNGQHGMGLAPEQLNGLLRRMAHREFDASGAGRLTIKGAPTRLNAILRQRQNIPPELRAVMGEHDDFRVVLEKTVHNLAWDIETYKFWKSLGDDGLAKGIFLPKGAVPTEQLYRDLPGGTSVSGIAARSPVEGMMTAPELKQALQSHFEAVRHHWWDQWTGAVKAGKTVLSVQTHGRNTISHSFSLAANGHAPRIAANLGNYAQAMRNPTTRLRAVELGVLGDGASAGEVQEYIRLMEEATNPVVRGISWVTKKAQRAYRAEDDIPKFMQWMAETEDRAWAGMGRPDAERAAADIVRDTTQTYSRTPQAARWLARNPIIGSPGVTFTFESARNLKNIARQAQRDIVEGVRTGNHRLTALGLKRATGLTVTAAATTAFVNGMRTSAGMDEAKEESFRRLAAPAYAKNAQIAFTDFKPGETVTYFDVSFINPYAAVLEPLIAAQRSIQEGAPAADVAWEVLNGIAGGDVLAETAFEVGFGRRLNTVWPPEIGGALWQKTDAPKTKLQEAAYRLYQGTAPGTVVTAERILRGAGVLPQTTRSGRQYNFADEVTAIAGPRFTTVEIPTAYRRGMGEIGGLTRDARTSLRGDTRLSGPEAAAARYLGNWQAIYEAAKERIEDGRNVGLAEEQLVSLAKEAGTPPAMIGFALRGRKEPPPPTMRPDDPEELAAVRAVFDLYGQRFGQAGNPYNGLVP